MASNLDLLKQAMVSGEISEESIQPAILMSMLAVLEEILEELRVQNDVDDEEQGHASLSDR